MRDWAGMEEEEEAQQAAAAEAAATAGAKGDGDDGGPRVLQVLGETVDASTLAQVLAAVLSDQQAAADPKGATGVGVNVGEVEAAAAYVVKRFGKSTRRVAEQALREVRALCGDVACLLSAPCSGQQCLPRCQQLSDRSCRV
jgi:hypothetical protein